MAVGTPLHIVCLEHHCWRQFPPGPGLQPPWKVLPHMQSTFVHHPPLSSSRQEWKNTSVNFVCMCFPLPLFPTSQQEEDVSPQGIAGLLLRRDACTSLVDWEEKYHLPSQLVGWGDVSLSQFLLCCLETMITLIINQVGKEEEWLLPHVFIGGWDWLTVYPPWVMLSRKPNAATG